MNFKDLASDPDFQLSTWIEVGLMELVQKALKSKGIKVSTQDGISEFDKEIGEIKEYIYKQFSKRFGFEYDHEGYYRITEHKERHDNPA